MKCIQCGKVIEADCNSSIILNLDGDFVCGEECKTKYERELDRFCSVILPNEGLFQDWLKG